jgi:hypothetical protein
MFVKRDLNFKPCVRLFNSSRLRRREACRVMLLAYNLGVWVQLQVAPSPTQVHEVLSNINLGCAMFMHHQHVWYKETLQRKEGKQARG